jgi:hypothetical protein
VQITAQGSLSALLPSSLIRAVVDKDLSKERPRDGENPSERFDDSLVTNKSPHQPFFNAGHARFVGREPRRCFIDRHRYFFFAFAFAFAFAFVPTRSFKAVAGRNATVVDALILIDSPVCGL